VLLLYVKMFRYTHSPSSLLSACICLLLSWTSALASAPAPAHSPEAYTELICHTSHASECYPAIFQPTEYFQRIREDQSIPPGLHVRLNLATGVKEARLNVPEPDDAPKADLVIIDNPPHLPKVGYQAPLMPEVEDQEEYREEAPSWPDVHDQPSPEDHDNFEGDLPFVPYNEADESDFFSERVAVVTGSDPRTPTDIQNILSALDLLTGLAHDFEWGITLARDAALFHTLVDYIDPLSGASLEIRSASAQLLATAIQNNAEALETLLAHYTEADGLRNTPMMVVHAALKASMMREVQDAVFQKRLLFLLTNLSPSLPQLQSFVSNGGLTTLLGLFGSTEIEPGVDGRDKIRMKVANYLQDHIIATIDGWPGHSLLDTFPPGTGSEILESQSVWREAMRGMEGWCKAFKIAFERYDIEAEAPGGASIYADNAYISIFEAHKVLERVLWNQGSKGECGYGFKKKTFASVAE